MLMRVTQFVRKHPLGIAAGAVALAVAVIGGVLLWNYVRSYESTDDAQIDGHLNSISPRISGTVTAVYVEDNQFAKKGQLLVDLDPNDYKVALQQARAAYAQAVASL